MNIHMFCGRRPGLLLSTMRAVDNLGLDIQQAVISCFNGFAMDIFRAEVLLLPVITSFYNNVPLVFPLLDTFANNILSSDHLVC